MLTVLVALALAPAPETMALTVDGVVRQATIFRPANPEANPPVIFGFHGHGGNMRNASRSFDLQVAWPQAVVVYPQGLPTKTLNDPAGGRPGWEPKAEESSKDIKFFDALYKKVMADTHGDTHRVFAMGHSNGGQFMYTLWSLRGDKFAAFGSCEGAGARQVKLTPKPFFITIGDEDRIVAPALQHANLETVFKVDGSASSGTPYGEKGTMYQGTQPVVFWSYHGGHAFPQDCVPTMIKFFQGLKN